MIQKAVKFYNMTPGLARPAFLNLCSAKHWNSAGCEQVFCGKKKLEAKKSIFFY